MGSRRRVTSHLGPVSKGQEFSYKSHKYHVYKSHMFSADGKMSKGLGWQIKNI